MMLYTSNRRPGVTLSCPARLMAIVCDNSDSENIYYPILQWAKNPTRMGSVLFDEYEFDHKLDPNDKNSFSIHTVESIERPIFVIDCESNDQQRILVAHDPDEWGKEFHSIP